MKKMLMGAVALVVTFVVATPGSASAGTPLLVKTQALVTPTVAIVDAAALTKHTEAFAVVVASATGDAFVGALVNEDNPLVATIEVDDPD